MPNLHNKLGPHNQGNHWFLNVHLALCFKVETQKPKRNGEKNVYTKCNFHLEIGTQVKLKINDEKNVYN